MTAYSRDAWVYHSLRGLLQVLMANVACSRDSAVSLANLLKQVNRLQRLARPKGQRLVQRSSVGVRTYPSVGLKPVFEGVE